MAELSIDISQKIEKILGIPPSDLNNYDAEDLIDELCETVFMLDEQKSVAKITALKEKIMSINGRIWNLLGEHDPKKARENLNGIRDLERYVGELKRQAVSGEGAGPDTVQHGSEAETEIRNKANDNRLRKVEKRVSELQDDLHTLVHTLTDIETLEEEMRDM